jgi:hypothetical protein
MGNYDTATSRLVIAIQGRSRPLLLAKPRLVVAAGHVSS